MKPTAVQKKWASVLLTLCTGFYTLSAQIPAVYPSNWWVGMKWNQVQLLIHHNDINTGNPIVSVSYPGVSIKKTTPSESPNYLLVDLQIASTAKPGTVQLRVANKAGRMSIPFELKARRAGSGSRFAQGVTPSDLVYLIMPDRFANGNPSNDVVAEYRDTVCDRKNPSARHGGDIEGVTAKLPYIKQLGATAIWLCPVLENDMPWKNEAAGAISGYHGYWITNHYRIDKRFGGEKAYHQLVEEAHKLGLKIVQDAVYNHVGDEHFLYKDKPFAAMFNQWPAYTGSNHREEALLSGYGSQQDKEQLLNGWFTPHLPDLNTANPYVANFLIQNNIWCTETYGIDGWRIDTYKYCDEKFLNRINTSMFTEYPRLSVFGEAWANTVAGSAYFTRNNMRLPFKHNLPGTTDFPMQSAMLSAVSQDMGWTDGVNKLMMTLAQDVLYEDPRKNCIFLDNHDVDRYGTMINGDLQKFKMGIGLLLTLRGIPQLYYGTEIFMQNDQVNGDGKKRNDFPGGFAGDAIDKFSSSGRTAAENEAFEYVQALASYRQKSKALSVGNTTTFLPRDGLFVYFRQEGDETVMCMLNQNNKTARVDLSRFASMIKTRRQGTEIATGKNIDLSATQLVVDARSFMAIALK